MKGNVLARFEDVLKFYPIDRINQQKNAKDYLRVGKIRERDSIGAVRISRLIDIPYGRINNWLMGKNTPRSIKGLKELESMKLLPLEISDSLEFKHFMITLGLRYADGCIYNQRRNNSYTFYICFGDEIDALKFVEDSKEA